MRILECFGGAAVFTLRMSLRPAVFARRITRRALLRSNCALPPHAALQLLLDFRGLPLFERIGATRGEERDRDQEEDRQALHLPILESERFIARMTISRRDTKLAR